MRNSQGMVIMSELIEDNKPVHVEFDVTLHRTLGEDYGHIPDMSNLKWDKVMETIVQHYPDMEISGLVLEGKRLKFDLKFKYRKTTPADIEWRLYNFWEQTPAMSITEFAISEKS